ncbi:MAG: hypothetical protein AMXMBFR34_35190 [Myxococcaceae bacterium]
MFSLDPGDGAARDPSEPLFSWLVSLRWIALLGVGFILGLAGPVFDRLPAGSAPWLWAVAGALAAYNAALAWLGPSRGAAGLGSFGAQITIDCLALAAFVHFAGGLENPFLPLFALHVVNANIVLSGRGATRVLLLTVALVAALATEGHGLLAHHCVARPGASHALDLTALAGLGGLVLTLVTLSAFTRFLTQRLHWGRRKLMTTVAELQREKDLLASAQVAVDTERERLQAIIDCMGDAVTFVDARGNVLFSNQRGRALWPAQEQGATPVAFEELMASAGTPGAPPVTKVTFERGGRTFETAHSLVRSAEGETLGLVMVARDLTERLAIEKRLMHDEQMSVVGRLAAAVAHEINNPIGVIFLYSEHALARQPPEPLRENLEIIHRNADACRRIVGGLLNLARPQRPEWRPVNLRRLCREIAEAVRPLALRAGVRVTTDAGEADELAAMADAGMLHQAVLNLAVNAVEAAGAEGAVAIRACSTPGRADGMSHAIEVRDTGPGIAPDELERVFQPFYTTKESGTGLGLWIAENVVRFHHGRIDVESTADAGTIFRVLLPEGATAPAPALLGTGPGTGALLEEAQ